MEYKRQINNGKRCILAVITLFLIITHTSAALPEGTKLPAFKLKTIKGKEIGLEDFKGRVVVLHLWKCQ